MLLARALRWKLITASVPASPAILGPVVKPPFASMGISGMLIEKLFPPITGTQSGIVRPRPLIPEIALLMMEITAFRGVFTSAPSPSKIPPKISWIPCHACCQFPVKTPVTKSMIPWKTAWIAEAIEANPELNASYPASSAGITTLAMLMTTEMTPSMIGSAI